MLTITPVPRHLPGLHILACILIGLLAPIVQADEAGTDPDVAELEIIVLGVEDPLKTNILAKATPFRLSGNARISRRRAQSIRQNAVRQARAAMRPYGFYAPIISSDLERSPSGQWQLKLQVEAGPPVLIERIDIALAGPGHEDELLTGWKSDFPLQPGDILDQTVWEEQKTRALEKAEEHGYLSAGFNTQRIELDLKQNRAVLILELDTGPQAVMGTIEFEQDAVNEKILVGLPRFEPGQPYDQWLLEEFRLDLWRTGYFSSIEVIEDRQLDQEPPTVHLLARLESRKKNTYQGTLGYGTDTGFRVQGIWNRRLLSKRGDSLDVGFGWQQKDNEINLRTTYLLPRVSKARQYWTVDLNYRTEQQNLLVRPTGQPDELIRLARGRVNDYSLRPGLLRIRNLWRGQQRLFERWYVQYLVERNDFRLTLDDGTDPPEDPELGDELDDLSRGSESTSLGVSLDWPVIRGNGFETTGHSMRSWLFTSNESWGSDLDFTQAYLSARWNKLIGRNWKFLARAEVGYTRADVRDEVFEVGESLIGLSVTELPSAYRFKAGGSQSVRGYGFEDLSNNNIGSNNIVTGSVELEYRFLTNWSAAAFFDAGNAFNDWSNARLLKGVGVGIRWYSIAGPIRLDFATALDEPGTPWRIHFTIGTPLL